MRPHGDVCNQSFGEVGCVMVAFTVMVIVRLVSHVPNKSYLTKHFAHEGEHIQ